MTIVKLSISLLMHAQYIVRVYMIHRLYYIIYSLRHSFFYIRCLCFLLNMFLFRLTFQRLGQEQVVSPREILASSGTRCNRKQKISYLFVFLYGNLMI